VWGGQHAINQLKSRILNMGRAKSSTSMVDDALKREEQARRTMGHTKNARQKPG
jgi:hypothetical protein